MPPLQLWAHRVRGLWPCVGWLTLMAGSGSAALAQPADPTALKWAFTLSAPLPAPGTQADTAPDANLPRATPWSALLDAAQQQAAANRVKHGRNKAEKANDARAEARRQALLDGAKQEE